MDVLDLSMKKHLPIFLSPPSSTTSSKTNFDANLRITNKTNKRPLRFQCKHCDYKASSTSLMQNHIYRHTDLTPYACVYCGHKSTTKSTIMVHIELCHPNMEVKILENRVREQDFYCDLNASNEPQAKRQRRSNQYDNESLPINGVAISLKTIVNNQYNLSPTSDHESYEIDQLQSMIIPTLDILDDNNEEQSTEINVESLLKLKTSPSTTPITKSLSRKKSESDDDPEYLLVYNRPKQYYGSLYEPDKQYACRLCSYTTNHRPSMEDHVFVHTNEKPYKCGYCGEEIYTRYAATYHIKYKHAGMPRNFIQNQTNISQYYVNRAKKDEEKNLFKKIETRRVKLPTHNNKSITKSDLTTERIIQSEPSPILETTTTTFQSSINTSPSTILDSRFLLAWSYYLATQTAWLSPISQMQQGQTPLSFSTDSNMAMKVFQAMQTVMNTSNNHKTMENQLNSNKIHSSKRKTKN